MWGLLGFLVWSEAFFGCSLICKKLLLGDFHRFSCFSTCFSTCFFCWGDKSVPINFEAHLVQHISVQDNLCFSYVFMFLFCGWMVHLYMYGWGFRVSFTSTWSPSMAWAQTSEPPKEVVWKCSASFFGFCLLLLFIYETKDLAPAYLLQFFLEGVGQPWQQTATLPYQKVLGSQKKKHPTFRQPWESGRSPKGGCASKEYGPFGAGRHFAAPETLWRNTMSQGHKVCHYNENYYCYYYLYY